MEIMPIFSVSGEKSYRAIAGDKHSVGRTAGQALDALIAQLNQTEFSALLFIRSAHPDKFFSAEQQERLSVLMSLWRTAREQGQELPSQQKAELEKLVEAELSAATAARTVCCYMRVLPVLCSSQVTNAIAIK